MKMIYEIIERHKEKFTANVANPIQQTLGRIAVIADSSPWIWSCEKWNETGMHADFSCFSFHAVKNLTTAEGGAVTWKNIDGIDNELIYNEYMNLSLHGQTKDALNKTKAGSWSTI